MARGRKSEQFTVPGAPIRELTGKVLGIVGYGTLGKGRGEGRARRARHAGARGRASGPRSGPERPRRRDRRSRVTLDEVLRVADVLSLHCPLTPATTGLIGGRELALMKPDALVINTARGALIDLEALVAALKGGDLGGAAIDVLPKEPPTDGSVLFEPGIPESAGDAAHRLGRVRSAPARGR